MKRTDNKTTENKTQIIDTTEKRIWWKNGSGTFHTVIDGRPTIIKPGQKFLAYEREIPKAFRNTIYSTDPIPPKEPVIVVQPIFEVVPSETDSALFDVINVKTKKVISAKPLEEVEAINFANGLNKK